MCREPDVDRVSAQGTQQGGADPPVADWSRIDRQPEVESVRLDFPVMPVIIADRSDTDRNRQTEQPVKTFLVKHLPGVVCVRIEQGVHFFFGEKREQVGAGTLGELLSL